MAVVQRTITDSANMVRVLINFDNHGSAATIDASGLSNAQGSGDKLEVSKVVWSLDAAVTIAYTGSGTTEVIRLAGSTSGTYDEALIKNVATQPGNATDADITVTPESGCDGFVYVEAKKTTGFGS